MAEVDHVVPVSAHLELVPPREVANREVEALDLREPTGENALLQRHRDLVLSLVDHHPLERERRTVGRERQELEVVFAEEVRRQAADVHDAEHASADGQRHADQRAAALAKVTADDVDLLEIRHVLRLPRGSDASVDAVTERHLDLLLDLRVEADGGGDA